MDPAAEGLLEGVEGEEARADRERLVRELLDDGVPLDELRRAAAEGRLALLPVERVLAGDGPRYTRAEVARESGLDEQFLMRLWRALGLAERAPDEAVFSDDDVRAARITKRFRDAGISDEDLLEVARVAGRAMASLAEANRRVVGQAFYEEEAGEFAVATRFAALARELHPLLEQLVAYDLKLQLLEQLRHDVVGLANLVAGTRTVTVAFADLVDFTRLGERVPADELGEVVGRLGELATDAAAPPVRVVKTIGDAVMLVSPEPDPLLRTALELVAAAEGEGPDFPALRAGVTHGDALPRAGDWYGRPVNLASRITDIARAGSVVATKEVREAADGDYAWSALPGRRRFKGIRGEVRLFRVRSSPPP